MQLVATEAITESQCFYIFTVESPKNLKALNVFNTAQAQQIAELDCDCTNNKKAMLTKNFRFQGCLKT